MNGTTTRQANEALGAWHAGNRRRIARGAIESVADGAVALGGMVLLNASTSLGFAGLPTGRAGVSFGAALISAGLAAITRHRARRTQPHGPVTARMRTPQPLATVHVLGDVA